MEKTVYTYFVLKHVVYVVNQSCLTAPLSDDTCQVKRVNDIEGGIRVASDWHEGGMAWHGMAWHGVAWHGIVYTRHIRKY